MIINLKKFYKHYYKEDCFVDVPNEVAEYMISLLPQDDSHKRVKRRNKAQYSLDRNDNIEMYSLSFVPSAEEAYLTSQSKASQKK